MVKTIACILMLIDHVGLFFFPEIKVLRIVGRFAMPFFAYGIARGYFCAKERGTMKNYLFNIGVFSVISQIPYQLLFQDGWNGNIGFTWLFSLLLLDTIERNREKIVYKIGISIFLLICATITRADYGVYGVLMPLPMYFYLVKRKAPYRAFTWLTALWGIYIIQKNGSGMAFIQIVSIFSIPMILFLKKYDTRYRLSKQFYYWFYPVHLLGIALVKMIQN